VTKIQGVSVLIKLSRNTGILFTNISSVTIYIRHISCKDIINVYILINNLISIAYKKAIFSLFTIHIQFSNNDVKEKYPIGKKQLLISVFPMELYF